MTSQVPRHLDICRSEVREEFKRTSILGVRASIRAYIANFVGLRATDPGPLDISLGRGVPTEGMSPTTSTWLRDKQVAHTN